MPPASRRTRPSIRAAVRVRPHSKPLASPIGPSDVSATPSSLPAA